MAEDPQPMTLQQRIAALNQAQVGRISGEPPRPQPLPAPSVRARPQVPIRRPILKHKSFNNPPEQTNATVSVSEMVVGNQPQGPPPLPRRKQSLPPPLPSRKNPQEPQKTENSTFSPSTNAVVIQTKEKTETTGTDGGYRLKPSRSTSEDRIKAPAWGGVELPPLPVKGDIEIIPKYTNERPKYINRAPSSSSSSETTSGGTISTTSTSTSASTATPTTTATIINNTGKPSLPPPLPTRRPSEPSIEEEEEVVVHGGRAPPLPSNTLLEKARLASFSKGEGRETHPHTPSIPARPISRRKPPKPEPSPSSTAKEATTTHKPTPPPVPLSSRPDPSAIRASKPKSDGRGQEPSPRTSHATVNTCMICRDFSGPDNHAALFPRQSVTSLQNLAYQLTSPFSSLTDKARVIFTWLHHNVDYNTEAFFNNNVKPSTPQSTLQSGLAVCEGYAALFANIATHAGLEALVVSGHGKGYGFSALDSNSPLPPYAGNHAWNVVKIDGGEWKLIDSCWGAGHVQGRGMPYTRKFTPEKFTMSNEEFAIEHFPANKEHFFLPEGRTMTWEDYIQINPAHWPYVFEGPTIFNNARDDYTIEKRTVSPPYRRINVRQPANVAVRFQFGLLCPHWTLERHTKKGPPPVFILAVGGVDGREKDYRAFDYVRGDEAGTTNSSSSSSSDTSGNSGGGDFWYVDVPARELGAPGQILTVFAVTSFAEMQDARGLSVAEFRERKGRVGMGFVGIAAWDLI